MLKIDLIRIFCTDFIDLGIASITAYLKAHDVKVNVTSLFFENKEFVKGRPFNERGYIIKDLNLPVILKLARNYKDEKPLCYGMEGILRKCFSKELLNAGTAAKNLRSVCRKLKKDCKKFSDRKIIGFAVDPLNTAYVVMMSLLLRKNNPDITIIYGGAHPTLSAEFSKIVLKTGVADFIVIGEGEVPLLEILKRRGRGSNSVIPGTMTYDKRSGAFVAGSPDAYVDLDKLPFPDFSGQPIRDFEFIPIQSSRGCAYSCVYCNFKMSHNEFRLMGHSRIIDMMEYLSGKYKKTAFNFMDNAVNYSIGRLGRFAEELLRRDLKYAWAAYFTPAVAVSKALAEMLNRSGLYLVKLGAESFSDNTLKRMGRPCDAKETLGMIDVFGSQGTYIQICLISGFPGETDKEFLETVGALKVILGKYETALFNPTPFSLAIKSPCYLNAAKYNIKLYYAGYLSTILPEAREILEGTTIRFKVVNGGKAVKRQRLLERYARLALGISYKRVLKLRKLNKLAAELEI